MDSLMWLLQAFGIGVIAVIVPCIIGKVAAIIADYEMQWIYALFVIIMVLGCSIRSLF